MRDDEVNPVEFERQIRIMQSDGRQLRQMLVWAAIGRELLNALGGCLFLTVRRRGKCWEAQAAGQSPVIMEELANALAAVNGDEPVRKCGGKCGRTLSLTMFSRDGHGPAGRSRKCKSCENQRVKASQRRKRLAAQQSARDRA